MVLNALRLMIWCMCYLKSEAIRCNNQMSEMPNFSDLSAKTLTIQNTKIRIIGKNKFKNTYFENNSMLEKVELPNNSPLSLIIINNPNLMSEFIFAVVKNLSRTKLIDLENNVINEIESEAFKGSVELKQIFLRNNKIRTIHKEALKGLSKLEELYLDENEIMILEMKSLNLDSTNISVYLSDNKLRSESFKNVFRSENFPISLHLENKSLTKFPENIFGPFLKNVNSTIYLERNIDCQFYQIKWVIENEDKLQRQIINLLCNDFKRDIFKIGVSELC